MKYLLFIISFFFINNIQAQCVSGNCKNGYGMKKYPNGTIYIGEWWNEKPSGKGTVIWSNGTIYVGDFKEGMYHGYGTLLNEQSLYVGDFSKNYPDGFGSFFTNHNKMYVGDFKNGEMHGKGFFKHEDGVIEETQWEYDKPIGDIVLERKNYILRRKK